MVTQQISLFREDMLKFGMQYQKHYSENMTFVLVRLRAQILTHNHTQPIRVQSLTMDKFFNRVYASVAEDQLSPLTEI